MTQKRDSEFKDLQDENDKIREELDKLIGLNHPLYSPIWILINNLIENEINQEDLCE